MIENVSSIDAIIYFKWLNICNLLTCIMRFLNKSGYVTEIQNFDGVRYDDTII